MEGGEVWEVKGKVKYESPSLEKAKSKPRRAGRGGRCREEGRRSEHLRFIFKSSRCLRVI